MHILSQLVMALTAMFDGVTYFGGTNTEIAPLNNDLPKKTRFSPPLSPPISPPPAIVLWHGLGDHYNSAGMTRVSEIIADLLPQTFVHSIYLDENPQTDERRSLFGDANNELDLVCQQLSNMTELRHGFGAIGFSQGGLFLRALVEKCPGVSVSTLMTFGSPHMGVLELPVCQPKDDWICRQRNEFLKKQVWKDSVQKAVIPAQYYRDPRRYNEYLEHSHFLAQINNERAETVDFDARKRFENLLRLVLVQFDQDTTLVPKESAFFQEIHQLTGQPVPLTETGVFKANSFGLRTLYDQGKVEFHTVDGDHMQISDDFFTKMVRKYFGGEGGDSI